MLAGELTFESGQLQGLAALYTVIERDPPTPSRRFDSLGDRRASISELRRTDPATLRSHLSGDLGWITMKAIEKEQSRRYETASALLSDIARYLNDEPVLAHAPSAAYRARQVRQTASRRRGAAGALALAILASSVVISYLAIEATRARDEADRRREQAEGPSASEWATCLRSWSPSAACRAWTT